MSFITQNIPEGAIRYNTDSNKMEVWIGDKWMIVATSSPNLDGGARGIFSQGTVPGGGQTGIHDYITLSTTGNAIEFGDTNAIYAQGCCADRTSGLFAGGDSPATQDIDFVTIASTGDATDFGDLYQNVYNVGSMASETRALFVGAYQLSPYSQGYKNIIQFCTIQTTGNALDFGDMLALRGQYDGSTSDCHGGLTELV